MPFLSVIVLLVSAIANGLLLVALIPFLRGRFLDHPNDRSSHIAPTPRGGGVGFVLLASTASAISFFIGQMPGSSSSMLLLFAFPIALVGFLDDFLNLSALLRFGIQLLTACFLFLFSPLSLSWLLLPLLIIAITAVINFTNFMDGLDGLVSGCMIVSISALCVVLSVPWPLWVLVGSLIGFLPWNWSPAKVFMGDVGSTYLGAVFAGLLLQASNWTDALCYLLLATPLLGDACVCVIRRLFVGQRVFQAHRLHLFQRLHQAGWSHARVSSAYILATVLLALSMLVGGWRWVLGLACCELLLGFWLDQRVATPFFVASKS